MSTATVEIDSHLAKIRDEGARSRIATLTDVVLWANEKFGWQMRPRQDDMLRAVHRFNKIAYRIGRQFGKTECLALIALYFAWVKMCPTMRGPASGLRGARILMASAKDDWAETLYDRTRTLMESNEEMRMMIHEGMDRKTERDVARSAIRIRLSPYKRIILPNGSFIDFRGPGDKGEGPRSKTYDVKIIDEADYMPKAFWAAEGPTSINAPAALTILSSTPTGKREHFYRACTDPKMGYKEFHISGEENPNMTEEKKRELLEELGPEGYDREIRANWGNIMAGVFAAECIDRAIYEGEFLRVRVVAAETKDLEGDVLRLLHDWVVAERAKELLVGCDLGTSAGSPCEILFAEAGGDDLDVIGIVTLVGASWPQIENVLKAVDQKIRVRDMAIDATGVGAPVCENLQYRGGFRCRLLPFDFSSNLVVGDGMRKNSKVWATDALVSMLQRGNLGLPNDDDLLYQFRNHTVDLSRGRPKYSKVDDHIVDAARCLAYAFFKDYFPGETPPPGQDAAVPTVELRAVKQKTDMPTHTGKTKVCGILIR
ncbi:hypothetical protein HY522_02910 [bacterium]|nr:hypothetical protein [bacterium]